MYCKMCSTNEPIKKKGIKVDSIFRYMDCTENGLGISYLLFNVKLPVSSAKKMCWLFKFYKSWLY